MRWWGARRVRLGGSLACAQSAVTTRDGRRMGRDTRRRVARQHTQRGTHAHRLRLWQPRITIEVDAHTQRQLQRDTERSCRRCALGGTLVADRFGWRRVCWSTRGCLCLRAATRLLKAPELVAARRNVDMLCSCAPCLAHAHPPHPETGIGDAIVPAGHARWGRRAHFVSAQRHRVATRRRCSITDFRRRVAPILERARDAGTSGNRQHRRRVVARRMAPLLAPLRVPVRACCTCGSS
jgi:hypothetical protein